MADHTNTPSGGSRTIGEDTPIRAPLGRVIALSVGLATISALAGIGYTKLDARIDEANKNLGAHAGDLSVHLRHDYHAAHGQPVGNFDFSMAIERLTTTVDQLKDRPILIGGDCKKVPGGVQCDQKKTP